MPELKIGDPMPDGTKYAGISPDTGEAMFTISADVPLRLSFGKAGGYTFGMNKQGAHGHHSWRVPTPREAAVLFNNRAVIGGFLEGWHWTRDDKQLFSAGICDFHDDRGGDCMGVGFGRDYEITLRPVCG